MGTILLLIVVVFSLICIVEIHGDSGLAKFRERSEALEVWDSLLRQPGQRGMFASIQTYWFAKRAQDAMQSIIALVPGEDDADLVGILRYKLKLGQHTEVLQLSTSSTSPELVQLRQDAEACQQALQAAQTAVQQKNWLLARSHYEQALAYSSLSMAIYLQDSWAAYHLSAYEDAVGILQGKVLFTFPTNTEAIYLLSLVYYQTANLPKALEMLRKGIAADPAHADMSELLHKVTKLVDFRAHLQQALDGHAYTVAVSYLRDIFALVSGSNSALAWQTRRQLVEVSLQTKKIIEAHRLLHDMLLANNTDYTLSVLHGQAYELVHDYELARRAYERAANLTQTTAQHEEVAKAISQLLEHVAHWNEKRTLYDVLCVDSRASEQEVRRAYREQSSFWHPHGRSDKNDKAKAEKMFMLVMEAHNVLVDAGRRTAYDHSLISNTPLITQG